ncbi:G-type lectin S-receptor-like serine/threonine-protein kinase At4g27290 [Neltuma alba]|uniref:G-type lectin S-receptor-like serine/threonine-protein kinase At4g27290 n=1 Tax=Neltuma alba TaxID=207710 RepID=UPI0010A44BDC|nr:G-type lectin S-receptor-like serine/threonine-protein kinase At4g27290 [Prosopis alba]
MDNLCFMSIVVYVLFSGFKASMAVSSIRQSQNLSDASRTTLVSQGGKFELGFFTPGNSGKRYLGIWYKKIPQTVVWVANNINPINDSSGVLTVNATGNLVLTQNNTVVWYTNLTKQAQDPVAELLDSGNFVVRDVNEANPGVYLWQSFDHPSNTLLAGMKLGWDLKNHLHRKITAWKSPNDPTPSGFSWELLLHNYPEFFLMKGSDKFMRIGPWNGLYFSGVPDLKPNPIYDFNFVSTPDEVYYIYSLNNTSVISRLMMNQTKSQGIRYVWVEAYQNWITYQSLPKDYCDNYNLCGPNGDCIISDSPVCQCLKGFKPKIPQAWNTMDWSGGCVRNEALNCSNGGKDGFIRLTGLKVPETEHTWVDQNMSLERCREACLSNCSCMAYTSSNISGAGSGCVMWFGDLIDIRQSTSDGQDLFIRMAISELEDEGESKKKLTIAIVSILGGISVMLLLGFCCYLHQDQRKRKMTDKPENNEEDQNQGESEDDLDLPLIDFSTIAVATNDFSLENKIGEGGFGLVYRGKLVHGQEIAVKRLSGSSRQGIVEFKNEVKLIAKLQHRNLVKLIGCCTQGEDKMLVYEYMPNGSLDCFIFDDEKGKVLDWSKRFHIICGIARGLVYLHQDSRLRIIHRDLKASNILLDDKLNPKISDFGIARIFGGDQIEGNTKRVVGTYGYMAPEYAIDGLFSVKSDAFSFGILLLEIISGKRSRGFYHPNHSLNLIGHAWNLWKEGRSTELIDSNLVESCNLSKVLRCIHVGLLCVQHYPEDRPTMPSVVLMLGSETELPQPKAPGFYTKKDFVETNSYTSQMEMNSTNEVTITLLEAR